MIVGGLGLHSSKSASDDRAGRAYRKRLVGADEAERVKAARAWTRWENCTSYLTPPEGGESDGCLWPLVAWAPFLPFCANRLERCRCTCVHVC